MPNIKKWTYWHTDKILETIVLEVLLLHNWKAWNPAYMVSPISHFMLDNLASPCLNFNCNPSKNRVFKIILNCVCIKYLHSFMNFKTLKLCYGNWCNKYEINKGLNNKVNVKCNCRARTAKYRPVWMIITYYTCLNFCISYILWVKYL